ncbi:MULTISPECIES: sensor histidine kinase KdpD [unclassified Vibrio]|uniref:histidine kinase n=1 Tax=Vibrio sp. HB236076 TaxID=3232307 RepID=A0AB39H9G7_9VIBR|nr:HAMP domain-containing sensor histidine kinase [Vibrio sp. HB161653]MDP5254143.1 HAMP domain-containing sensor histidine kinase [Vibrio sp. HB161653]
MSVLCDFLQLQYQESHRRQTLLQLSHDLKTPLSSVLGYLETWRLQPGNNNPLIDVAHRNSLKLSKQLQSMLTQAKQQAPMPRYHYVPLNLETLIEHCTENILPQFYRRHIELEIKTESDLRIIGDKALLERLLNNLFDNALRHSPKGGKVICRAKRVSQQGLIEFSIENNIDIHADKGSLGIGIHIVQSILMLHHSHLQTEQTAQRYRQRFCLLDA